MTVNVNGGDRPPGDQPLCTRIKLKKLSEKVNAEKLKKSIDKKEKAVNSSKPVEK